MNNQKITASKLPTSMNGKVCAIILLITLAQSAFADSIVQRAQQALKEQGFYYGEVTGEKNADTIAAIRRFQIRNGLSVTGELNDETLKALDASRSASTTVQPTTPVPSDTTSRATRIAPTAPAANSQILDGRAPTATGQIFTNTPYETAPPELQRRVLRGAQTLLRRDGYYKGNVDGAFGPDLEFSLRAYQSSSGIQPSGRLDLETLAALGLLPGQHGPALERPRRRLPPQPLAEPPVRGEWIRESKDRDEDGD